MDYRYLRQVKSLNCSLSEMSNDTQVSVEFPA